MASGIVGAENGLPKRFAFRRRARTRRGAVPAATVSGVRAGMTNDHVEQERLSHMLRQLAAQDAETLPPAQVHVTVMNRWDERIATGGPAFTASPRLPARPIRWTRARVSFGFAGIAAMLLLVSWVGSRMTEETAPTVPPPSLAIAEALVEPIQSINLVEPQGATSTEAALRRRPERRRAGESCHRTRHRGGRTVRPAASHDAGGARVRFVWHA